MSCIWSESQLVSRFWLKLICRDMSQTHNRIAGASISYLCSRSIRSRTRNNIRFLLSYFRFMISSIPLVNYSSPVSCMCCYRKLWHHWAIQVKLAKAIHSYAGDPNNVVAESLAPSTINGAPSPHISSRQHGMLCCSGGKKSKLISPKWWSHRGPSRWDWDWKSPYNVVTIALGLWECNNPVSSLWGTWWWSYFIAQWHMVAKVVGRSMIKCGSGW